MRITLVNLPPKMFRGDPPCGRSQKTDARKPTLTTRILIEIIDSVDIEALDFLKGKCLRMSIQGLSRTLRINDYFTIPVPGQEEKDEKRTYCVRR